MKIDGCPSTNIKICHNCATRFRAKTLCVPHGLGCRLWHAVPRTASTMATAVVADLWCGCHLA